jgi:NTE family protein
MPDAVKRIAIACQGGGSHAVFTAGVLVRLLDHEHAGRIRIAALSGTSGGAMCAALAWAGLASTGAREAQERLTAFWHDVETQDVWDATLNFWTVLLARLPVSAEISPYAYEPAAEPRLRALLAKHLRLEALPPERRANGPRLLIGATDIGTGDRTVFEGGTLTYDALIASAAVPPLFRAVPIEGHLYWDGLFSTNPPVRELTDGTPPDEIWVVQINPQSRAGEPRSIREITDRRNELSGNLSLAQELYFIEKMNRLLADHDSLRARYRHIDVRVVEMSADATLDYPSKLDRSEAFLEGLFAIGKASADEFFREASRWPRSKSLPERATTR